MGRGFSCIRGADSLVQEEDLLLAQEEDLLLAQEEDLLLFCLSQQCSTKVNNGR